MHLGSESYLISKQICRFILLQELVIGRFHIVIYEMILVHTRMSVDCSYYAVLPFSLMASVKYDSSSFDLCILSPPWV